MKEDREGFSEKTEPRWKIAMKEGKKGRREGEEGKQDGNRN